MKSRLYSQFNTKMNNTETTTYEKLYSRLSIIGNFSTLLFIAYCFQQNINENLMLSMAWYESILVYILCLGYLSKKNSGFLTFYFDWIFKKVQSTLTIIIGFLYAVLLISSLFIPNYIGIYFQYILFLMALIIPIYGIVSSKT